MQADLRPFWKKLTNIGLAIVAVATTVAPFVPEPYSKIALIIAAVGAAIVGKGAARRADAVRAEALAAQAAEDVLVKQWRKAMRAEPSSN